MTAVYPLDTWDYVVFSLFLALVSAMGLYHSFAKGGQQSTQEYLLANRSVLSIPVAMTLLASFVSPMTLLGDPAEIYLNGGVYINSLFSSIFVYPLIIVLFIPVFYGLDITSAYEYLDQRFDMKVRILGAIVFFFQTGFYMAIVTYSPALAIEAVTNFDMWKTILITGVVCTIYTSLGGMKAVIWTDVIMFCVMFGTMIMVLSMGCIESGGFTYVWKFNKEEERLDIFELVEDEVSDHKLSFPKDLTAHMSFPSVVIGNGFNMLALWAVGQTSVQRMLAAKSLKDAKISMWLNLPFTILIKFLACFQGLVLYAYYFGGSIATTPAVTTVFSNDVGDFANDGPRTPPNYTSSDQILIYFISEQFGNIPGYQGLFIACLFASTLSTVSSGINAMTAVTLVDVIRPFRVWKRNREIGLGNVKEQGDKEYEPTESYDTILTKVLTVIYGCLTIGLAFLATKMGTLISMAYTIFGAVGGPLVGTFSLGILWKRANSLGTLIGLLAGASLGIWIAVGSTITDTNDEDVLGLYKLSVMWFGTFTVLTTVIFGVICSEVVRCLFPEERDRKVKPELLATFLRPKEIKPNHEINLKFMKENDSDRDEKAQTLAKETHDDHTTEKPIDPQELNGVYVNDGFGPVTSL